MADLVGLPGSSRVLTEYEALVAAAPAVLEAIPGAVCLCDAEGMLVRYNQEAAELWGRRPRIADPAERFCGAFAPRDPDGRPLRREDTPMAAALATGEPVRHAEVLIERPDGGRVVALANVRVLKDAQGRIQGAIGCLQDMTARKAHEDETARARQDLEDFFENSAVGLHVVGPDGTILRANRAELELLGYAAEEYVGHPIREFHVDAAVIDDIILRLSRGERLDHYPARLRARDGTIKHVLITSNSRFEDGRFASSRCFTMDVTERHAAEAARRDSEQRLAATYESATIGIAETDEAGRFVRVNEALAAMTGYSRDELLTRSFADITHPDDVAEAAACYARQVSGALDRYCIEKRYVRRDGAIIDVEMHSSSVHDAEGRFRYGVRVIQDVTGRKRMQDELRESERRLRDLLEAIPAAVYTTDTEGRITFYNQAAVEFWGLRPELGSSRWCGSWRLLRPDGTPLPHDACPMATALKERRPIRNQEAVAERPDGTRVPFMPYPTPLYDAAGRLIGAVNMLVDITHLKEAERRQRVMTNELDHRAKNVLAVAQAMLRLTRAPTVEAYVAAVQGRIASLARVHTQVADNRWEGVGLRTLVRSALEPFRPDDGALLTAGPNVMVDPACAQALGIVLHELATNAAKHGALSVPGGIVEVSWDLSGPDDDLALCWRERNGPPVRQPARRSFGSRVIERQIPDQLGGTVRIDWSPAGLGCTFVVPCRHLAGARLRPAAE